MVTPEVCMSAYHVAGPLSFKLSQCVSLQLLNMASARWLLVILECGKHIGRDRNGIIHDGKLSTALFLIALVSLGISIDIATWAKDEAKDSEGLTEADQDLSIILCMIISSSLMITLIVMDRLGALQAQEIRAPENLDRIAWMKRVLKERLPMIGLVSFLAVGATHDIWKVFYALELGNRRCPSGEKDYHCCVAVLFLYHMMRASYMALVVYLAHRFLERTIRSHVVIFRYMVMFIQGTNLMMWMDSYQREYAGDDGKSNKMERCPSDQCCCVNQSHPQPSTIDLTLVRESSDDETLVTYLIRPIYIEFALLVTELLAHLFFAVAPPVRNEPPGNNNEQNEAPRNNNYYGNQGDGDQDDENAPLIRRPGRQNNKNYMLSGLLGVAFNAVFCIALLLYNDGKHNHQEIYLDIVVYSCKLLQPIISLLTLLFALYHCRHFRSRYREYTGLDFIVALSAGGYFIYSFVSIISLSTGGEISEKNKVELVENLAMVINIFVQTVFMLHVRRIEAGQGREEETKHLKRVLLFNIMSNFTLWLYTSLWANEKNFPSKQQKYYGKYTWTHFTSVVFPFMVFYRFNSTLILLGGFLEH